MEEAWPGILGCLWGGVRQGWLGQEQWHSSIVLGFFGRVVLLVGKPRSFEIMGLGEDHPGRGKIFELYSGIFVHFIEFVDLCHKLRVVI